MIAYDMICENAHKFEGWFKCREDFIAQKKKEMLECPVCASKKLEQMSAPAVRTSKNHRPRSISKSQPNVASALTEYLEKNFEDVGRNFAEEARKIHYEEAEARNIRGIATKEETESLREEGIHCITLAKQKLNS